MTITLLAELATKILVPLGTTVAAFIAAYASRTAARASWTAARVAESQRELAERQYALQRRHQELEEHRAKQELYDRRLGVYQAVRMLDDAFSVYKPPKNVGTFDDQEVTAFSRDTAEGDFLFGDEISYYLKEMGQKARRLVLLTNILDPTSRLIIGTQILTVDIDRYTGEQKDLQLWFDEQFKIVKEKFKPYLNISTPGEYAGRY